MKNKYILSNLICFFVVLTAFFLCNAIYASKPAEFSKIIALDYYPMDGRVLMTDPIVMTTGIYLYAGEDNNGGQATVQPVRSFMGFLITNIDPWAYITSAKLRFYIKQIDGNTNDLGALIFSHMDFGQGIGVEDRWISMEAFFDKIENLTTGWHEIDVTEQLQYALDNPKSWTYLGQSLWFQVRIQTKKHALSDGNIDRIVIYASEGSATLKPRLEVKYTRPRTYTYIGSSANITSRPQTFSNLITGAKEKNNIALFYRAVLCTPHTTLDTALSICEDYGLEQSLQLIMPINGLTKNDYLANQTIKEAILSDITNIVKIYLNHTVENFKEVIVFEECPNKEFWTGSTDAEKLNGWEIIFQDIKEVLTALDPQIKVCLFHSVTTLRNGGHAEGIDNIIENAVANNKVNLLPDYTFVDFYGNAYSDWYLVANLWRRAICEKTYTGNTILSYYFRQ